MVKPEITVSESGDFNAVKKALNNLSRYKAYVGIPEKTTSRKGDVTNAGLLYIHTHGAHLSNGAVIPPRPVIEPAIEASDNKARIEDELEKVAAAELDGNVDAAVEGIIRVGTLGANAAKRWFRDPRNHWLPNAPSTIAKKGSDRPLIDSGELRRAITHVEEY